MGPGFDTQPRKTEDTRDLMRVPFVSVQSAQSYYMICKPSQYCLWGHLLMESVN
jgi:hypothetical protein